MEKNEYIAVYFGEDGVCLTPHTKKSLEVFLYDAAEEEYEFLDSLPDDPEDVAVTYKHLLIKGSIVVPEPVETVVKYLVAD
jgi:hypothetical protein